MEVVVVVVVMVGKEATSRREKRELGREQEDQGVWRVDAPSGRLLAARCQACHQSKHYGCR